MPRTPPSELPEQPSDGECFVLRLYVAGNTVHSTRAIVNVRRFCEEELKGRYELAVLDVSVHRQLAAEEQLVVLPTLVKLHPGPVRRFIGDFTDTGPMRARLAI